MGWLKMFLRGNSSKINVMKKIISIALLVLGFISCRKDNLSDSKGSARLTLRLTDSPALYDKVNIDIIGANAIIEDSIIKLDVHTGIYNLLDFVNGKDTLIVDQQVPSGMLSQVRLILGDNNTVLTSTGQYDMKTPSAQQSGLKLNVHTSITQGIAYEYVIDFDAARSIVRTGNGGFILKPVLKVAVKAVSGAIAGIIFPAEAKPVIYAISSDLDSVSTTSDVLSGNYMFTGLAAGIYKLSFAPQSPFKDTTLLNISVQIAMVTKLDTLKFK